MFGIPLVRPCWLRPAGAFCVKGPYTWGLPSYGELSHEGPQISKLAIRVLAENRQSHATRSPSDGRSGAWHKGRCCWPRLVSVRTMVHTRRIVT